MRAAKMKERPAFQLMCQTDVQNIYHKPPERKARDDMFLALFYLQNKEEAICR